MLFYMARSFQSTHLLRGAMLVTDLIAIGRRVVMGFRSAHLREVWLITFFFRCIFYFDPRRQHSAECGDLKLSREAYRSSRLRLPQTLSDTDN